MRTHARKPGLRAHALVLALAAGLAQAQVATPPPVPPVPPAQADPVPPVSPVPVTPPAQAQPDTPAPSVRPPVPAAPPETTPPAAAAHQAAELARGDPARWHQEDATAEQRLRTRRKEIAAAYEEAKMGCKRMAASERTRCLKDARTTHEKELA
ncbi:MAG TPA: hypothetical protein VEB23_13725, partial [Ramlibacter sp.]|nr:hypothetical protein [Ramlibacter sp.]